MRRYAQIEPDGLTGAILAIEGIRDGAAVLNGPTGCKAYHSALSDKKLARSDSYKGVLYQREFYFGQSRVPATYLDQSVTSARRTSWDLALMVTGPTKLCPVRAESVNCNSPGTRSTRNSIDQCNN